MRRTILPALTVCAAFLLSCRLASAAFPQHAHVVDASFNFTALQPGQQAVAAFVVQIDNGFHAQSHTPSDPSFIAFKAKVTPEPRLKVYEAVYPPGEVHDYGDLGKLNVYTGQLIIYLPVQVKPDAATGDLKLTGTLRYQCCDNNVCYPPSTMSFTVQTTVVSAATPVETQKPELFKGFDFKIFSRLTPATTQSSAAPGGGLPPAGNPVGSQRILGFELRDNAYVLAFFAAFIAGIIFNAVPCVLPVLPIKAIGFYEASQHSRAKSVAFGAVFSAGLIASFFVLALLVVVYHKAWGDLYTNGYFTLALVIVLAALALGTFGLFNVNLPPAIYSVTPRHDTYLGNFLFGILTAVLSTPCTFGMFVLLLAWAARQTPAIGVALVMTVGVGMAFPYFLLSAMPELARRFPRTGPWGEVVKQMMAFLLLASAVYFARRFIQPVFGVDGSWWSVFAVVAAGALFLIVRAFQISSQAGPRLASICIAALMIIPAFAVTLHLITQPYQWKPYTPEALAEAHRGGHVAVVEFTAVWCGNCQYLEAFVLHQPEVIAAVKKNDVVMLRADLTSDDAPGWALNKQLSAVAAVPMTAIYSPYSNEPVRLAGIYSARNLRDAIKHAATSSASPPVITAEASQR